MDPSCLVSTVQAAGGDVMVWGKLSLASTVPTEHCLNTVAYQNIVIEHVHPFMAKVYPPSVGCFQSNAPCPKAQINSVP